VSSLTIRTVNPTQPEFSSQSTKFVKAFARQVSIQDETK
jgi:hypothetical protein